jgi:hypothetical protein
MEALHKKATVYNIAKKSEAISVASRNSTTVIKKRFKFMCTLNPILMGVFGEIGYSIRLDLLKIGDGQEKKRRESVRQPLFQFRFDIYEGKFVRELKDANQAFLNNKNPVFF